VDGGYSDSRTRARSANARRASVELGAKRSKPWGGGVDVRFYRDAGGGELLGVGDVLVAEDV